MNRLGEKQQGTPLLRVRTPLFLARAANHDRSADQHSFSRRCFRLLFRSRPPQTRDSLQQSRVNP